MGFRLVQKSVTLNAVPVDRVVCVISPNSVDFTAHCAKVMKTHRHILRAKCSPKNLLFSRIWRYSQVTPARALK